ncbi:hypothetical protein CAPTEDRAFT_1728 [Capitella teleta]|uniref:ceramide glucosyltransferase n=1 Tax=Capitella teleta TaxID=283909 RepID=R7V447_CAPTE|nr:hypothetical protein CAPTEDRAFT_1728 [Capitella teleta]|eukprot:ELU13212.1 hypothetical protein CAPTEDRAFT_1728 [Capitella teleta]
MLDMEGFIFWLAVFVLCLWCCQWYTHLVAIIYGKWRLHHKRSSTECPPVPLPGMSIIKPLTGVDPNLYANLEPFFNLQYPAQYELLFCDSDPAIIVVKSLLLKNPNVRTELFMGAKKIGMNPKINNMITVYGAASHDLILISDSGLRMKQDTLSDMVQSLTASCHVGLVRQIPFVCNRNGFAGILEKVGLIDEAYSVFLGTQHANMYLNADLYGINCVTVMSCLFRKKKSAVGVSPSVLSLLGRIHETTPSQTSRREWWAKLRQSIVPLTLLEPHSESLLCGLLASWAVHVVTSVSPLVTFGAHLLAWLILDYVIFIVMQCPFSKCEFLLAWLVRESTSLFLFLRAYSSSELTWRNKRYLLDWGGIGREVPSTRKPQISEV